MLWFLLACRPGPNPGDKDVGPFDSGQVTADTAPTDTGPADSATPDSGDTASADSKTFYLDCSAPTDGDGSSASPWNALDDVNAHGAFNPGHSILLRRGTTCTGMLTPAGSGTADAPIALDAWGDGALPAIVAPPGAEAAIKLYDQHGWSIRDLDLSGGDEYVLEMTGGWAGPALANITIQDLQVHDCTAPDGNAMIYVYNGADGFSDVLIDGIEAWNAPNADAIFAAADNLTISNSTCHDLGGAGMWVAESQDVTMEGNVVWNTGSVGSGIIGIWEWTCTRCTVQYNEVHDASSANHNDGGTFDVDYYSHDNTVQYNYGHDTDGYCVSVFGAGDGPRSATATSNTVIRWNVCANTGQGPGNYADYTPEGSIYLATWSGGWLDGVAIYNNTFFASPTAAVGVLDETGWPTVKFDGTNPDIFANNLIWSDTPLMVSTTRGSPMVLDHNLYWYTGGDPTFSWEGTEVAGLAAWQALSGQDSHSVVADPLLGDAGYHDDGLPSAQVTPAADGPGVDAGEVVSADMGGVDFLGTPVPQGSAYDIGAVELPVSSARGTRVLAFVGPPPALGPDRSRTEAVTITSLALQHQGVRLIDEGARLPPGVVGEQDRDSEIARAWGVTVFPTVILTDDDGVVLRRWNGFVPAAGLGPSLSR